MSHRATSWAFSQRDLKPATKLILVYLADCHNDHTGRCDPSQNTLADGCGMSRSTVNLHLQKLEADGLIRRIQRSDKRTKKQENTLYILGCDDEKAVSENRTREKQKPCPKKRHSRVRKNDIPVSELSDTNRKLTVKEPRAGARVREGVREEAPSAEVSKIAVWEEKVRFIREGKEPLCRNIRRKEVLAFIRDGLVTVDQARKVNLVTLAECRAAGFEV